MAETYLIYISLLILTVTFVFLGYQKNARLNELLGKNKAIATNTFSWNIYYGIALFVVFFVSGFRSVNVGNDYSGYYDYYILLKDGSGFSFINQKLEVGYYGLNKLFAEFNIHPGILFGFLAGIIWYFYFRSFWKFYFIIPIAVFFIITDGFFFWTLNGIRQAIAITIFMFSIQYLVKGDIKKYLIFMSLAALFHTSVILFIPIYFLRNNIGKHYNKKLWLILYFISFLISQNEQMISNLQNIILYVGDNVPYFSKYIHHLYTKEFEIQSTRISGYGVLSRIAVTFLIIFFSDRVFKEYPDAKIYFILFFIGAIVFNLFYTIHGIGRVNSYLIYFRAFALALTLYYFRKQPIGIFIGAGIAAFFLVIFLSEINNSANACSPYEFNF